MADHSTATVPVGTGSSPVTMTTDSVATNADLNLQVLNDRVRVLEQNACSITQSDSYLQNRIRELEIREGTLLSQLSQIATASHLQRPSMHHSQRLDQRLHSLRDEVRTMTQEKEREERVWRERLQRCTNQLRAKEEEMSRQSQYFQNFKTQLQHKLSLARDREQSLQARVHTLEKQLLDMTVSAATNMATVATVVGITTGSALHKEAHDRMSTLRGEGEGEEGEKEEEKRRRLQRRLSYQRGRGREEGQGESGEVKDGEQEREASSGEARLRGFILSLQEDLRVLLEREEQGALEQRRLTEQLQEAQERSHFLACTVEEAQVEVHRLQLSENCLIEEVEELRRENQQLYQHLREAMSHTPSQTLTGPGSGCTSPGPGSCSLSPAPGSGPALLLSHNTAMEQCSPDNCAKAEQTFDEQTAQLYPAAPPPLTQQVAAENTQNSPEVNSLSAKQDTLPLPRPDLLNLSANLSSKCSHSLLPLSFTPETEELGALSLGSWCSGGTLSLEQGPSEEADALSEAYRSLGLGEDLEALAEQRGHLEVSLRQTTERLNRLVQENTRLKSQLRQQGGEQTFSLAESTPITLDDIADNPPSSATQSNAILTLAQDDLSRALNQENRALAERIQELMGHLQLQEEENGAELAQLRERVSGLEADGARLEQENKEQGFLITELTRKTEDDLNTIMELQQMLTEHEQRTPEPTGFLLSDVETCVDGVQSDTVGPRSPRPGSSHRNESEQSSESLLQGKEEPESSSIEQTDQFTADLAHVSQDDDHTDPPSSEVDRLTKSLHSLKEQQEELQRSTVSLSEEKKEVALWIQTQTEEKQHLTRLVWGLKEERDGVTQSLCDLKQEKEQLTRIVCGLNDERDQFKRSMGRLKDEEAALKKAMSELQEDREKLLGCLRGEKQERDHLTLSLQSLQRETEQLSLSTSKLKRERDELTESLRCLEEQRDKEQSSHALKRERDELLLSVGSLKEEKDRTERLLSGLKREEDQVTHLLSGLREERDQLQVEVASLHSQSQSEGSSQRQHLSNQSRADWASRTEVVKDGVEGWASQDQSTVFQDNSVQNEKQSDLMKEVEALGCELRRSKEELEKTQFEAQRWCSDLALSEMGREEAELRAAESANEVMRLTDVANQLQEATTENDRLTAQVKQLQSRLTGLAREKTDILSLKRQIEEQLTGLQAQLKAKTVALEELNSEYTNLRRNQESRESCSTTLATLRTRYDDIRAKYDVLLKRKSQTDLDIAPLKAKVSCLVQKCQERNSLLVQMMRMMKRHGCVDLPLTQWAEHLLSDTALQDYTAAFTLGPGVKVQDYTSGFTLGSSLNLHSHTNGITPIENDTHDLVSGVKPEEHQNRFLSVSSLTHKDHANGDYINALTSGSTANLADRGTELSLAPKDNANSTLPINPTPEHANVQMPSSPVVPALTEGLSNTTKADSVVQQTPPSGNPTVREPALPPRYGPYQVELKGEVSPVLAKERIGSPLCTSSPSLDRCVTVGRRLSSPEKIISIHQELQKTLSSSVLDPVRKGAFEVQQEGRGRGKQPRRGASNSATKEMSSASQTKGENVSIKSLKISTNRMTPIFSQTKPTALANTPTTIPPSPTTLFAAVSSRSSSITFNHSKFAHTLSKAAIGTTTPPIISPSPTLPFTVKPNNTNSNPAITPNVSFPVSQLSGSTTHTTAVTTTGASTSVPLHVCSSAAEPSVLTCSVTAASTIASNNTVPKADTPKMALTRNTITASPNFTTAAIKDGFVSARPFSKSAPPSPGRSSTHKSSHPEKVKAERPAPEAPAEVGSVEVIRTVGQSSLMIGWERPLLDELGCSKGTFVYGYRVYVDGEFHKSVMSSACTKCILENVDLSGPVHISVQTLGSNGLRSDKVHTMYRTSLRTDGSPLRTDHQHLGLMGCQSALPPSQRHSGLGQKSPCNPPQSSPPSPQPEARTCMAIYSYSPLRDSPNLHPSRELALREGDTVTLLGRPGHDGFCEAQVNGRRGLAPVAFLEELLLSESRPTYLTS